MKKLLLLLTISIFSLGAASYAPLPKADATPAPDPTQQTSTPSETPSTPVPVATDGSQTTTTPDTSTPVNAPKMVVRNGRAVDANLPDDGGGAHATTIGGNTVGMGHIPTIRELNDLFASIAPPGQLQDQKLTACSNLWNYQGYGDMGAGFCTMANLTSPSVDYIYATF